MEIIQFFTGLSFFALGLAAYLQGRQGGDIPLKKQLIWLAYFGFVYGFVGWLDMFLGSGLYTDFHGAAITLRMVLQPISGFLLLRFGYGVLVDLTPLPNWTIIIPGLLLVPIVYVIIYAATTFITPSPLEIPIDIWSRYLLYFPGSIFTGLGFIRQWSIQKEQGLTDVSRLMLAAGLAFLFEALVVGFIVPAAPTGPASYYNYDRVVHNALVGRMQLSSGIIGLDYEYVIDKTGLPIQFWRLISSISVTYFMIRGLDVFDTTRNREKERIRKERDDAQKAVVTAQISARNTAETWTNALVNISRKIAQLEMVDELLPFILEQTLKLFKSDYVAVGLLDDDQSKLLLKCHAFNGAAEILPQPLEINHPMAIRVLENIEPHLLRNELTLDNKFDGLCSAINQPVKSLVLVPLTMENLTIGVLWTARCAPESEHFSKMDTIWLDCIADQIVITIQHGIMTSQLQSFSIIEERGRIAREMHDGLAQVLGYLNMQIQTLASLLRKDKKSQLEQEMKKMHEAIQTAHADVRENILSLRTTLAEEKGLITAIHEYLSEFGIQTGIETKFSNNLEKGIHLSSLAEVQVVCILQEALTNVRKHAKAKNVEVCLDDYSESGIQYLSMSVIDDGVGFLDVQNLRSFGLKTMRERATGVNASFEIESRLKEGTKVTCILPGLRAEDLHNQRRILPYLRNSYES